MTLTDRKMSLQLPDTSPAGPVSGKLYIAYETNYNDHLNYFCDGTAITRKFTYFYISAPNLTSNSMVISKHHLPEHEI